MQAKRSFQWRNNPWLLAAVGIAAGVALTLVLIRPREEGRTPTPQTRPDEPTAAIIDEYLARMRVGVAAFHAQRYAEATAAFDTATALQPSEHLPYRYLAELHWRAGRQEQALEAVRSLATLMPDAYFLDQVGRAYEEGGLSDLAVQVYEETVRLDSQFPGARYNLGRVYLEAGDLERGIAEMREALRLHPDFPEASQALGMAYTEQGRVDEAVQYLKRALAIDPTLTVVRNHLGRLYLAQGRLDDAIDTFQALIERTPDVAEARHNLAVSYARQGSTEQAIAQFRAALRLRPDFHAARIDLAAVFLEMGRPHETIDTLRQALTVDSQKRSPGDAAELVEVRYRLGLAYRMAGQPRDAIRELETVLQLHPKHAGAHANLGLLYYQAQRFEPAWKHARQAEALGVAMGELLAALRRVSVEPP